MIHIQNKGDVLSSIVTFDSNSQTQLPYFHWMLINIYFIYVVFYVSP